MKFFKFKDLRINSEVIISYSVGSKKIPARDDNNDIIDRKHITLFSILITLSTTYYEGSLHEGTQRGRLLKVNCKNEEEMREYLQKLDEHFLK